MALFTSPTKKTQRYAELRKAIILGTVCARGTGNAFVSEALVPLLFLNNQKMAKVAVGAYRKEAKRQGASPKHVMV